jgi:hypothetical protein
VSAVSAYRTPPPAPAQKLSLWARLTTIPCAAPDCPYRISRFDIMKFWDVTASSLFDLCGTCVTLAVDDSLRHAQEQGQDEEWAKRYFPTALYRRSIGKAA